ncbi:SirB2 family protein [Alloalcanivorax gelatiniphagus]|uniref:Regulator SirB n=1 Tax=Alloalcanivorax gelatiniphagus TaxID=1194167 RepID=A0ABY2XP43_9GAMM|nr:SirB2 family protein [Alloalcanivorax gelatiniphagus]TMW13684.1 regulator SirB [Alloalcanivorax gelatiniphagus]
MYTLIKHLHISLAAASITLFVTRAWWSVRDTSRLRRRWVRVLPHVIDTGLLACGVTLMVMLRAWPQHTPWLAAKLVALLVYIGLGAVVIKGGRSATLNPTTRATFAVLAVAVFAYMVGVAVRHHPASWLA